MLRRIITTASLLALAAVTACLPPPAPLPPAGPSPTASDATAPAPASAPVSTAVPSPATASAVTDRKQAALVRDAETFMAGYARDILAGDRTAISARYDRRGAYMMGNGRKALLDGEDLRARYADDGGWAPPATFAWRELSYEPVGSDAVVVTGLFDWGAASGERRTTSYTGLLVRQDGALRIRIEDESRQPAR